MLNFEQSTYINSQNHKQPMYYLTRDGFTLLAMGYNGSKAMQFREEYGIDKKADLRSYFDKEQLQSIKSMEMLVSGLVDCGWDYNKIKSFIEQTNTKSIAN